MRTTKRELLARVALLEYENKRLTADRDKAISARVDWEVRWRQTHSELCALDKKHSKLFDVADRVLRYQRSECSVAWPDAGDSDPRGFIVHVSAFTDLRQILG